MAPLKSVFIWVAVSVSNAILLFVTIFLQLIGYGTSPKIEARSEAELKQLISDQVFEYNKIYFLQILIIGLVLFAIDYLLIRLASRSALGISLIMTLLYFVIVAISLIIISFNFADLNLKYFPNP